MCSFYFAPSPWSVAGIRVTGLGLILESFLVRRERGAWLSIWVLGDGIFIQLMLVIYVSKAATNGLRHKQENRVGHDENSK